MSLAETQMRREIEEIPAAVERLITANETTVKTVAGHISEADPKFLMSVARGSSDHACTFLKYASELLLGRPMASVGPSVASIYNVNLSVSGSLCISVSQSGKSPDIVQMTRAATDGGAFSVALTNNPSSPLGDAASAVLPIEAGPELSVAATKTFVNSLVAGIWMFAEWKQDQDLIAAIKSLPAALDQAVRCDWSPVVAEIKGQSLYTLGRGPSWAIANEAALKFKETCQIHAESYSSAEVMHGPVSIVEQDFPVLAFASADAAEDTLVDVADSLAGKGASVFVTSDRARAAQTLPHVRTDHWLTDPVANIVSFYAMVERVAVSRGINPDAPRHLKKVTETV